MITLEEYQRLVFNENASREIVAVTIDGEILRGHVGIMELDKDAPDGSGMFEVGDKVVANRCIKGIIECPIGTPV